MIDPPVSFNLWTEPWIWVTDLDSDEAELSIAACLAQAHALAALSDPSPAIVGGTHRLLTAILQAIHAPRELGDLVALLQAGQFDAERLKQFGAQFAERFDIFHPTAPFLQAGDVPLDSWRMLGRGASSVEKALTVDPKPVSYLFSELPTATNRTHYHHAGDAQHRLCPACAARGLISIPAFAMSQGRGYAPTINGDPPIYIFPVGRSLFESLACSLMSAGYLPRTAHPDRAHVSPWHEAFTVRKSLELSAVGYIESLTFPVRRVRLFPSDEAAACTHCGRTTSVTIATMLFEMGHWLSKDLPAWQDPFVALRRPARGPKNDDTSPKPVRPEEGRALWREYNSLLLAEQETQLRPGVVRQFGKLVERGALPEGETVRFRCVSVRNPSGKAIVHEWSDEALDVAPALLNDDDAGAIVEQALQRANDVERTIRFAFDRHFRPRRSLGDKVKAELTRYKTVRARLSASYWQWLAPEFRGFVFSLSDEAARETSTQEWVRTLMRVAQKSFDQAAEQLGDRADVLRARVIAQDSCRHQLAIRRKEWFDG